MIGLMLLGPAPTVAVERAYAALAQTRGQWTAFRATAAPGAIMFVPQPVDAGTWLSGRLDPPVSVMWWPGRAWISCDRRLGINFGPWVRRAGAVVGTFTTVWARQADGAWKWQLDFGGIAPAALAAGDAPREVAASCRNLDAARRAALADVPDDDPVVMVDGAPRPPLPADAGTRQGAEIKSGRAPDGSLRWQVLRTAGSGGAASYLLRAWRWDGSAWRLFLFETSDPGS